MKWNNKQIQFIPQKAISEFIYSKNYYFNYGNSIIYVKNKNKRFFIKNKKFSQSINKNNFNPTKKIKK